MAHQATVTEIANLAPDVKQVRLMSPVFAQGAPARIGREAQAHVCRPVSFMQAVRALSDTILGPGRCTSEAFPADLDGRGGAFEVILARSGRRIAIRNGESLLDTLLAAGIAVDHSCKEGARGACVTGVLAGRPDHRDALLTPGARAAGRDICLCVSRTLDPALTLDL